MGGGAGGRPHEKGRARVVCFVVSTNGDEGDCILCLMDEYREMKRRRRLNMCLDQMMIDLGGEEEIDGEFEAARSPRHNWRLGCWKRHNKE